MKRWQAGEGLLELLRTAPTLEQWVSRAPRKRAKKKQRGPAYTGREAIDNISCNRAALDSFFAEMNFPHRKACPSKAKVPRSSERSKPDQKVQKNAQEPEQHEVNNQTANAHESGKKIASSLESIEKQEKQQQVRTSNQNRRKPRKTHKIETKIRPDDEHATVDPTENAT